MSTPGPSDSNHHASDRQPLHEQDWRPRSVLVEQTSSTDSGKGLTGSHLRCQPQMTIPIGSYCRTLDVGPGSAANDG